MLWLAETPVVSDLAQARIRNPHYGAGRFAKTRQTSDYIGVSDRTMEGWRQTGIGPPYIKAGGTVLYDLVEIDRWLSSRRRRSTSDSGRPAA